MKKLIKVSVKLLYIFVSITLIQYPVTALLYGLSIVKPVHALYETDYDWTKTTGDTLGTGTEFGYMVDFGSDGSMFRSSSFSRTSDFDPGAGVDTFVSQGAVDIALTKFNSDGSYGWTRAFGESDNEAPWGGIAVDSNDHVYISGMFDSTNMDFDGTSGVDTHSSNGGSDGFLTKYASNGDYIWTVTIGGTGTESTNDIDVDSSDNIIVSGSFQNTNVDFDPSASQDLRDSTGDSDCFVVKYDEDGNYLWARTWGGTGQDKSNDIMVDSSGNIYIAGRFSGTNTDLDPTAGTDLFTSAGDVDGFVTKLTSSGSYEWTRTFGGTGSDRAYTIATDKNYGAVYISGRFYGSNIDFDGTSGTDLHSSNGDADIFVTKYALNGDYEWTDTSGGTGFDFGWDNVVDKFGNIFVAAACTNTNQDICFTKYNADGNHAWTHTLEGSDANDLGRSIGIASDGKIILSGKFESTNVDFDVTAGTDQHSTTGGQDMFLSKYEDKDRYRITPSADIDVVDEDRNADASVYSRDFQGFDRTIQVSDADNSNMLADIEVDVYSDLNWASVSANSNRQDGKSFFHYPGGLSALPGSSASSYSLYIPIPDGWVSSSVVICPNATSLAEVTDSCTGAVTKYPSDADTNIVTVSGHSYWKVDGLTSTGGLSLLNNFALKDTLTRLEVSQNSNHTIEFGTINGLTAAGHSIEIEFDPAGHNWNLTGLTWQDIDLADDGTDLTLAAAAGVDTWGVSISTVSDTITVSVPTNIGAANDIEADSVLIMEVGTNTTFQSTGTNQITNPSTVGEYEIEVEITNTATETGEVEIPIVDDDTVNVTGYLDTVLSFDIDTASTNMNCDASGGATPCNSHSGASDGSGYTIDLGEMTLSTVSNSGDYVLHSDGLNGSINYIWFDLESNSDGGTLVTVVSQHESLYMDATNEIPSVAPGAEVQITAASGTYGINHGSGFTNSTTLGSLVVHIDCDCGAGNDYYCDVQDGGTPIEIFNSNSNPVDDGRIQWAVGAAPDSDNGTGTYTDQLTFVATSTF